MNDEVYIKDSDDILMNGGSLYWGLWCDPMNDEIYIEDSGDILMNDA